MRSLKSLALGAAAAALLAGAGLAVAQTPPAEKPAAAPSHHDRSHGRSDRMIRFLDTDKDGKVSLKEIEDEEGRILGAADVNGDGKLSPEEFQRRGELFMRLRVMTLFDLLDTNGDEQLTKEELAAPTARWFKRYDKDSDGFLTAEEMPHGGPMGRPGGHSRGPRH